MVKFSEDLWNSFEAVNVKTETGLQVLKDVSEFLKTRANIENEYAKKIAELCKKTPGAGVFSKGAPIEKEAKTLRESFLVFTSEGTKISTHHQEFANRITNEVVKPLDTFVKTKEPERKKLVADGQKRLKAQQEAKANAEKARDTYQKTMKEGDAAAEQHEKAKAELANADEKKKKAAGDNEKRAQQKVTQLEEKGKAAEAAYQKAVETANEVIQSNHSTHIPPILDSLQQIETERYQQVQTVLSELHRGHRQIPDLLIERADEISKALEALDIESDLNEFIEANKSAITEPELLKFIPYKEVPESANKGKSTSPSSSSSIPAASSAPAPDAAPSSSASDSSSATTADVMPAAVEPVVAANYVREDAKNEDDLFSE